MDPTLPVQVMQLDCDFEHTAWQCIHLLMSDGGVITEVGF